jgi:chromosome partitioning protein
MDIVRHNVDRDARACENRFTTLPLGVYLDAGHRQPVDFIHCHISIIPARRLLPTSYARGILAHASCEIMPSCNQVIAIQCYPAIRMRTIAVVSQKGGAGKTTLALHIAVAAEMAGQSTAMLDLDPQGTAEAWAAWRKDEPPEVIGAKASTLQRTLEKASIAGAALVVIDTPPMAQAEARAAAQCADLILIPCRPRPFDLHAIQTTAGLILDIGKPAFVIFNAGPPRGIVAYSEAAEVATMIGFKVAPVHLTERAAFHVATRNGRSAQEIEPEGKAAAEVADLWAWIGEQLHLTSHPRRKAVATK